MNTTPITFIVTSIYKYLVLKLVVNLVFAT